MSTIIVGEGSTPAAVAEALGIAQNASIWAPPACADEADRRSSAPLARALVALEAELTGGQHDEVLLADDSDAALAAALVATKVPVALVATEAARAASSENGRLIAQLAPAYTRLA